MNENPIKIVLAGDFCPINRIEDLAHQGDYKLIFNDFIDVFQGNDLNIVDLECPLTEAETARLKTGPHQKSHSDMINILKHAGIDLLAMANNHILDYDDKGITDTLELCEKNAIQTMGVGRSQGEAAKPFSLHVKGKQVAILNFADREFISTSSDRFVCNAIDPINMYNDMRQAANSHQYVVVVVHGGNEHYELPSPRIKQLYRFIIDSGADAVIAHHTHVFSGYELYRSKPIFYGLGNFIYDWPGKRNTDWNIGYVVKLILSETVDFKIIPLKQSNEKPGVFHLNDEELEEFENRIETLNRIIKNDDLLEDYFQNYCKSVFPMYDAYIEPYFGSVSTALRKRGFFPKLITRRKRLLLLNLIRCESHRDVLIRMLEQD